MKILSGFLILVAFAWFFVYVLFDLALSSITESEYSWSLTACLLWLGPILLLLGAIFVAVGWHARLGTILVCLGVLILTGVVVYVTSGLFHVQPLEAKPPYAIYAVMIVVTILADLATARLLQLVWVGKSAVTP